MNGIIFGGTSNFLSKGVNMLLRLAGSHRIATWLRAQGWDIEVVDFLFSWSHEELVEFCKQRITNKTIFVGFSCTFPIRDPRLSALVTHIRETYPHVKIIAGGQSITMSDIDAHFFIDGYGEHAMDAVLKFILHKEKLKYTLYRNGKLVRANLDYPAFPMAKLPIRYEDRDYIQPTETLVVELARGCKFKCKFCNYPILGVKSDHSREGEDFVEELNYLHETYGVTTFTIADETINDTSEKLEKFANASQQFLRFKPWLTGTIRFDLLLSRPQDKDFVVGMNLWGHHYGIETFNWDSGKAVGKGMHPDKIKAGLIEAKKYFRERGAYRGFATVIAGLPYDTKESVNEMFDWFKENWKGESISAFSLGIPRSGGKLVESTMSKDWDKMGYEEMSDEELAAYGDVAFFDKDSVFPWKTKHMNIKEAEKMIDKFNKLRGHYFSTNPFQIGEWRSIFGYSIEEALNLPVERFITVEDRDKVGKKYINSKLGK